MRVDFPPFSHEPAELRRAFSLFPSGVVALLAEIDGEPAGMVASAFTVGVSIEPPLVSCAVQRSSQTWPRLRGASRIGVTVLGEGQGPLARQLSGRDRERRFDGVPLRNVGTQALFVHGSPLWLECTLWGEHPAGDHTVALLQVQGFGTEPSFSPLVFHGSEFRSLQLAPEELG